MAFLSSLKREKLFLRNESFRKRSKKLWIHLFHAHFTSGYGESFANIFFLFFIKSKCLPFSYFTIIVVKIHEIIFVKQRKCENDIFGSKLLVMTIFTMFSCRYNYLERRTANANVATVPDSNLQHRLSSVIWYNCALYLTISF